MPEINLIAEKYDREVMRSKLPVLIDFWADWCGPCRMLGPVISELAEIYEGKVKVCKVNVDDQPRLADSFHVESIPHVVLMKKGSVIASSIGYKPIEQLQQMIDSNL